MSKKNSCPRRKLAQKGVMRVDGCKCCVAHVEIGAMTLRLQYDALRDLSQVLQTAVNNITNATVQETSEELKTTAIFGPIDQNNKLANQVGYIKKKIRLEQSFTVLTVCTR